VGAAAGGVLEADERRRRGPAAPVQLEPAGAAQAAGAGGGGGVGVRGVPGRAPGGGRTGAPALRTPLPLVLRRALGPGRLALPRLPRPGPPRLLSSPQLTELPTCRARAHLAAGWLGRSRRRQESGGCTRPRAAVRSAPRPWTRPDGSGRQAAGGRARAGCLVSRTRQNGGGRERERRQRSGSDDGARRDGALNCDRTGRHVSFILPVLLAYYWSDVLISLLG
jgi:hypothetical protein